MAPMYYSCDNNVVLKPLLGNNEDVASTACQVWCIPTGDHSRSTTRSLLPRRSRTGATPELVISDTYLYDTYLMNIITASKADYGHGGCSHINEEIVYEHLRRHRCTHSHSPMGQ
ncbi:hypothetical protein B5X24_HaOG212032 [Helicoverpa armigera]|nr:hypothetical protein B5X24_HaOG212032 [Helicoverpa armigera]